MESNKTEINLAESYVRVNQPVWIYFGIPLWIFGTVGNVITLTVILRKRMRTLNVAIYLIALVITDLLVQLTEMFPKILTIFTGIFLNDKHIVFCKTLPFISETSLIFSSWVTVAISFERMLCVRYPLWSSRSLKMSNRVIVIISMLISLSFITGVKAYWREIGFDVDSVEKSCFPHVKNKDMLGFQETTYYTFYSFIPAIILFICSMLIGYELRNRFLVTQTQQRQQNSRAHRTDDTIRVLTFINTIFFLTTVPFSILNYIAIVAFVNEPLVYALGFMDVFIYVSNSVNFLSYIASGRAFRNELRQLCFCFFSLRRKSSQRLYLNVADPICNTSPIQISRLPHSTTKRSTRH